ncbi:MAG: histidinol-phosphatase HisJ family protein [Anaerovoracaceae bacterium]|jgi:histidinol-phosphatase (PHP family)
MYDYHVHCSFSPDSRTPMTEMVQAAAKAGLREIAITDHYDPDYRDPAWPVNLDFDSYHKEMEAVKERYRGDIKLVKGIEIGVQHGSTLDKCKAAVAAYDYDFVLASFHCAEGYELSHGGYFDERSMEETFPSFYKYVYDCLKEFKDYSVLGHINVVDRYSLYVPEPLYFMDMVEDILKMIIYDGRGIEINTSSFRYGMGEKTTPSHEMLRLYKDLGGEIITVGSDAHSPLHIGSGLEWGYDKLRSLGFRYFTTFDKLKPSFIKL